MFRGSCLFARGVRRFPRQAGRRERDRESECCRCVRQARFPTASAAKSPAFPPSLCMHIDRSYAHYTLYTCTHAHVYICMCMHVRVNPDLHIFQCLSLFPPLPQTVPHLDADRSGRAHPCWPPTAGSSIEHTLNKDRKEAWKDSDSVRWKDSEMVS